MAKIGIVGDIHLSRYSSILRSRGSRFSTRLEGLVQSLNWVEKLFKENNCVEEVFLGDTFDTPDVDSETITALSEVEWNTTTSIRHFIVGNHESGVSSLQYNSTQMLYKLGVIENVPKICSIDEHCDVLFLPYITEDNRQSFESYIANRNKEKKLLVFSHNDLKNFQMGKFISTTGFDIDEIDKNCDIYFNGHLHNGGKVSSKVINLGNLSGQNFSEDAFKYEHHVAIIDTETLEVKYFENPYAFNFYKVDIESDSDLSKLKTLKSNSVVSIKCSNKHKDALKETLEQVKNIISYKIIYMKDLEQGESQNEVSLDLGEDHIKQFRDYIIETLGEEPLIIEELNEVCR